MFKILIDTCVWLDLAKDHKSGPLLDVLAMLVKNGDVELLVPRVIVDEFARNKARVAKEGAQSLSSALRRVREAVWMLDVPGRRAALAKRLTDLDLKLPSLGENAVAAIGKIEALIKGAAIIETSEGVKVRAAERALAGRAPFHRSKNSMGDAVLIEIYTDALAGAAAKGNQANDTKAAEIAETLRNHRRRMAYAAGPPQLKQRTDRMIDEAESVAKEHRLALPRVSSRFRGGQAHGRLGAVDLIFEVPAADSNAGGGFDALADTLAEAFAGRLDCNHEVLVERVAPTPPLTERQRYVCFHRLGTEASCRVECRDGSHPAAGQECPPLSNDNRGGWTSKLHIHVERDERCTAP